MSLIQTNGVCPALLIGANEALRDAQNKVFEPIGFVQSLLDPNNRTTAIQVDSGNGHSKQVRVMHKQRMTLDELEDTVTCDPTEERPRFEEIVTVNMKKSATLTISEDTIRQLCDAYSQLVVLAGGERNVNSFVSGTTSSQAMQPLAIVRELYEDIALNLNTLIMGINMDLITAMTTKVGKWKGGDTSKNFSMYTTATGAPVFAGFNVMRQELAKTGFAGRPIVVGGGNFDLASGALQYGCCNDSGIDFGKMASNAGFQYYRDYNVDGADGFNTANQFLAFMPGTMQLVTFNENKGNFGKIGLKDRGLIALPSLPGVMADMSIKPDDCNNTYTLKVWLNYDLYASPTNLFQATDPLYGVNGVFKAVATAS